MPKKYLIICPAYPPEQSGLAGYTHAFASELAKSAEVSVLTSSANKNEKNSTNSSVKVFATIAHWNFLNLIKTLDWVLKLKPDRVILQYLPFLYSPRSGIHFGICAFALILRIKGVKVDLICHELHYPLQANWKAAVMFTAHILMLQLLGLAADRIFASTIFFQSRASHFLFWRKNIFHLPVGSNMPLLSISDSERRKFAEKNSLENYFLVTHFGTLHPTRDLNLVCKSVSDWAQKTKTPTKILCIGESSEKILSSLENATKADLGANLVIIGKVDDREFATAMILSDATIAYFTDGATTRRGSLLAPLLYGVPSISTITPATEPIFQQIQNLYLLSPEPKAFSEKLQNVLSAIHASKKYTPRQASIAFNEYFSWSKIVRRYQEIP